MIRRYQMIIEDMNYNKVFDEPVPIPRIGEQLEGNRGLAVVTNVIHSVYQTPDPFAKVDHPETVEMFQSKIITHLSPLRKRLVHHSNFFSVKGGLISIETLKEMPSTNTAARYTTEEMSKAIDDLLMIHSEITAIMLALPDAKACKFLLHGNQHSQFLAYTWQYTHHGLNPTK
jgi:hypothetical protein